MRACCCPQTHAQDSLYPPILLLLLRHEAIVLASFPLPPGVEDSFLPANFFNVVQERKKHQACIQACSKSWPRNSSPLQRKAAFLPLPSTRLTQKPTRSPGNLRSQQPSLPRPQPQGRACAPPFHQLPPSISNRRPSWFLVYHRLYHPRGRRIAQGPNRTTTLVPVHTTHLRHPRPPCLIPSLGPPPRSSPRDKQNLAPSSKGQEDHTPPAPAPTAVCHHRTLPQAAAPKPSTRPRCLLWSPSPVPRIPVPTSHTLVRRLPLPPSSPPNLTQTCTSQAACRRPNKTSWLRTPSSLGPKDLPATRDADTTNPVKSLSAAKTKTRYPGASCYKEQPSRSRGVDMTSSGRNRLERLFSKRKTSVPTTSVDLPPSAEFEHHARAAASTDESLFPPPSFLRPKGARMVARDESTSSNPGAERAQSLPEAQSERVSIHSPNPSNASTGDINCPPTRSASLIHRRKELHHMASLHDFRFPMPPTTRSPSKAPSSPTASSCASPRVIASYVQRWA